MNQKAAFIVGYCLLLFSFSVQTVAASSVATDPFVLGKQAFQGQDYSTAVRYFQLAFIDDPANIEISFYLGLAATEAGEYETGVMSFERILIMQPGAMRVKLELARCYMRLRSFESAKQYFYEVLAGNPPRAVRINIDNYLSAIAAAERRHFFSGTVSAGISFDDNIRSSPGDFLFTSFDGLNFVTHDLSAPSQSDYYTTASVVVSHIYRREGSPFAWKTTATTFNNLYGDYHDLDVNLFGLSTGPAYETPTALYEVHGMFHDLLVEHDPYMRPMGIGGSAIVSLSSKLIASATTTLQEKRYQEDSNSVKDATTFTLGLSPILMLGNNRITVSLGHEQERADADYWSYNRRAWGGRYDRVLPVDFTAFAGFNRQRTEYGAIKPGDVSQRLDRVSDFYCGVTKLLWQAKGRRQNLLGQLSYTYTESDSTVSVYDYRKNVSVAMFSYGF